MLGRAPPSVAAPAPPAADARRSGGGLDRGGRSSAPAAGGGSAWSAKRAPSPSPCPLYVAYNCATSTPRSTSDSTIESARCSAR